MEEIDMDDRNARDLLLNDFIDYGNSMVYDIDRVFYTDSEHNNDSYTSDLSQDMNVDIKNQMGLGDNCEENWLQLLIA